MSSQKDCVNCATSFTIADVDYEYYEKFEVPEPTHCPDCRQQRRLAHNNEMQLYYRKCDYTGEDTLSYYSADKPLRVFKEKIWWEADWGDPIDFGKDVDFSRPFFEQMEELFCEIPHFALQNEYTSQENCDFCHYAGRGKDCYLIFHADFNRDCYYGYGVKMCESCVDVYNASHCELCYECIDCRECYNLRFAQNCRNCSESYFLRDCIGCRNCIACKGLVQKEYHIFNEAVSESQYHAFLSEHDFGSYSTAQALQEQYREFCLTIPSRHLEMTQVENSLGDYLFQCRNVQVSYSVTHTENARYCYQIYEGSNRDIMDLYQFGLNAELAYEGSIVGGDAYRIRFCHIVDNNNSDQTYCQECSRSKNLFGCIGLRGREYCLLNKQYSKDQYHSLMNRVIEHMKETGEWGEFFPISMSAFGYNETTAQLWYPMDKSEALAKGYKWKEEESGTSSNELSSLEDRLPDSMQEVDDSITKEKFCCLGTGKSYRIMTPELRLYRQLNVPLPRYCFHERHRRRLEARNPRMLRKGKCAHCDTALQTSIAVESKNTIYCETCYQEAVH